MLQESGGLLKKVMAKGRSSIEKDVFPFNTWKSSDQSLTPHELDYLLFVNNLNAAEYTFVICPFQSFSRFLTVDRER